MSTKKNSLQCDIIAHETPLKLISKLGVLWSSLKTDLLKSKYDAKGPHCVRAVLYRFWCRGPEDTCPPTSHRIQILEE